MNSLQSVGFQTQSFLAHTIAPDPAPERCRTDGAESRSCLYMKQSFPSEIGKKWSIDVNAQTPTGRCPIYPTGSEVDNVAPSSRSCPYRTLLDRQLSYKRELKWSDNAAAEQVLRSVKRRSRCLEGRILANLIGQPRAFAEEYHNDYLEAIVASADLVFFCGRLAGYVRWEWSHHAEPKYDGDFLATTSLRRLNHGGLETLIILSRPILCSGVYEDRLVITTFLHELIHCYLFICCGENAAVDGGHTAGFKTIARRIDSWSVNSRLYLRDTKADLSHFRAASRPRMPSLMRNERHQIRICQQHDLSPEEDRLVDSRPRVAEPKRESYDRYSA